MQTESWTCPACESAGPLTSERCPICACPRDASESVVEYHKRRLASVGQIVKSKPYKCVKCGGLTKETGELRASGGALSSIFDISTNRFKYVTCSSCGYTEFYRADMSGIAQVAEWFGG
ncbi:zinc ribbon domain-containing protein [Lysobacter fragariae]